MQLAGCPASSAAERPILPANDWLNEMDVQFALDQKGWQVTKVERLLRYRH